MSESPSSRASTTCARASVSVPSSRKWSSTVLVVRRRCGWGRDSPRRGRRVDPPPDAGADHPAGHRRRCGDRRGGSRSRRRRRPARAAAHRVDRVRRAQGGPGGTPPPNRGRRGDGCRTGGDRLLAEGGTGKTVLATNIAAYLATRTRKRVLLIDLDLQFGDAAIMLGLDPERTMFDLVQAGGISIPASSRDTRPGIRPVSTSSWRPCCPNRQTMSPRRGS